ncbi:hypothetical protein AB1K54_06010 [Microbacterium sp. BWT-B31]|uniref:hypothetical protein n=1 Tax=Microbacterium sp. BWT-B31 TaxID=3232072 RepID=UPI0035273A9A
MILRALAAAVGVVATMVVMSGCSAPTPSPTAVFASEDEAFAAAEETYRAYNDAVNARWANPGSAPDSASFLVDEALEDDLTSNREFESAGLSIVGENWILSIEPVSSDLQDGTVVIDTCLDVTPSRIVNAAGTDVTPADRPEHVVLRVDLVQIGDRLLIRRSAVAPEIATC